MVLHESIRINYDSDEELEDGVRNSSNSGKEGLMKRESVTALLPDEEDIEGQHQHLEKADPEAEGGKWYSIQAIRHNVKANEGFLLIASSQLFFAIINTLVKLLQQVSHLLLSATRKSKERYFERMPSISAFLSRER